MSVSKMKRLTVFAHKTDADHLIRRLMRLRCVNVSVVAPDDAGEELSRMACDSERMELESSLARIQRAMTVLNRYSKEKRSLFRPRTQVDMDAFARDGFAEAARFTVSETVRCAERQTQIKQERLQIEQTMAAIHPYLDHDLPLDFGGTERTENLLGVLPGGTDLDKLGRELYEAGAAAELIYEDKNGKYIWTVCHKDNASGVSATLTAYGFSKASFRGIRQTAEEYRSAMSRQQKALNEEEASLENQLRGLADGLGSVEILYDYEQTSLNGVNERQKLLATENTVMLNGWVPAQLEERVANLLNGMETAYEMRDPTEEETPPVLLRNNRFAVNFEWVLGMYSYPARKV